MRILYDYQAFYRDKVGGVSRYFAEIISNLPNGVDFSISAFSSINIYVSEYLDAYSIPYFNNRIYRKIIKSLNQNTVIKELKHSKYDIFHATDFDTYYLPYVKSPKVITIHDMIWEKYNLNAYVQELRKKQILSADKIITVSEWTKKDLLEIYNVSPEKVVTIYHGVNTLDYERNIDNKRYVLFVGKRKGYKNFSLFLQAMSSIINHDQELRIICVGLPFNKNELELINNLDLSNNIEAKFVSDAELYNLYSNALLFVYPSKYEGFGIPILEAFYCRCPVALSNSSCFPEIGQNAVDYFEPNDVDSLIDCIKRVIYDENKRKVLIEKGTKRLANFSWEKSANETVEVYNSLL